MRHLILYCIQIQKEVSEENKFFERWICQKALELVLWCLQGQVSIVIKAEAIQQFQDLYLSLKLDK